MKQALLLLTSFLLLGLLTVPNARAQMPFPTNGMGWATESGSCFPCTFFYNYYQSTTDTVVAGKSYKNLNSWGNPTPYGGFHTDQNNQTFFRNYQDSVDQFYFDWSAQVGDTLLYPTLDDTNQIAIVDMIDSVMLIGQNRAQWTLQIVDTTDSNAWFPEVVFQEGIGCANGLFFPYEAMGVPFFEWFYNLHCIYQDDDPVWGVCYPLSTPEEAEAESLSLFPNPVALNEPLQLKGLDQAATVEIRDLQGKLMYQEKLPLGTTSVAPQISTPGIYLVRLESAGASVTKKLVVSGQ